MINIKEVKIMTKKILKVLNLVAFYGSACGWGWILGKIAAWLIAKIGVDQEFAEAHPWRTIIIILAATFLVIAIPSIVISYPLALLKNLIDDKIDDMDDPEWEK